MASFVSKIKRKFSKKNREEDRRKSTSEETKDNADKQEEQGPSCSSQEVKSSGKEGKDDAENKTSPSSCRSENHADENGHRRNGKEIDKGKENQAISLDSGSLEMPDYEGDEDKNSLNESFSSSKENIRRESTSNSQEESPGNCACENESLDESLGSMLTDTKPLPCQDNNVAYEASNNLSSQDRELVMQLQDTEIINATRDKTNGQLQQDVKNMVVELQGQRDLVENAREAQEHSLRVHAQEEAQAKVEPLVSDILSRKAIEDRICLKLDRGSNVISNWEHLACELKAPAHIKAQCRRTTNESPTELLFESFKSWRHTENLTVNQLITLLGGMKRRDAVEIIEKAIPAQKRENKVSDEITSNPELLEELATKLDKESRVIKSWRHIGLKLGVKEEILQEIGNGNSPNAVEKLFEYIYATMPGLTVEVFKEKMEKIRRIDVRDLVNTLDKSGKMKEVIPLHSDLMCSICYMLNKSSSALKDWKHFASELGIDYNTYKSFEPESRLSPTSILLEWVCSEKGEAFTVQEFRNILARIKRFDVIEVLEKEFGQKFIGN